VTDLAAAEEAMLRMTCERLGLADGMDILEAGLWMGIVDPLDGRDVSTSPNHRCIKLFAATPVY
jgi:hypothetical protein